MHLHDTIYESKDAVYVALYNTMTLWHTIGLIWVVMGCYGRKPKFADDRRPPCCCCCAFRFCLQQLRQPCRIQFFALRSSFLMVLVWWSVCSSWWSAEWSVDYSCFWFMVLTLLNVLSNSAIDHSTVSIFQRPHLMGITTKESWTCMISLMRNVCGLHETNLPPPKLCELSSLIVDSVYWLSVPISVSLHVKVSDLVVLGVHVWNGSVAVCHVL